jgi:serine/threonine protein phosphatase PrpC
VVPIDALQIACVTNPGMVRDNNEDAVGTWPEIGLVVVADGMGGGNAGEVASGMVMSSFGPGVANAWTPEALKSLYREQAMQLSQSLLQTEARRVNAAIFAAAESNPEYEGMGTTLVAALYHDDFLTVAHIGDSRLYRIRGGDIEQVTKDHSLLQEQIDSGFLRKEDAHLSNNKNLVTRAVGVEPEVEAEVHSYEVLPDDVYLLCSDGLHGMVEDGEIGMTVAALRSNLDLAAKQLVQAANDAGGRDNVSVILLRITKGIEAAEADEPLDFLDF